MPKGQRHCPAHARSAAGSDYQRRRRADEAKGEDRGFYWSKPWRAIRKVVLKEEPYCWCGCGRRSNTVDHIKDRKDFPALALARSNLRAAYANCHNRRTAAESGGFGNRKRDRNG